MLDLSLSQSDFDVRGLVTLPQMDRGNIIEALSALLVHTGTSHDTLMPSNYLLYHEVPFFLFHILVFMSVLYKHVCSSCVVSKYEFSFLSVWYES